MVRNEVINSVSVEKTSNTQASADNVQSGSQANKNATKDNLQDVVELFKKKLEKFSLIVNTEAEFKIDRDTGMIVVKIKNKETGEIIRQIPPEVMVKLAKTIDEFLGLLFDERV
ncbi:MAG: flagellar protein FlaG [Thermotogaceae bacterium]|nr:flagellar protein FlaG [Thermotogaceae bacterium]